MCADLCVFVCLCAISFFFFIFIATRFGLDNDVPFAVACVVVTIRKRTGW